MHKNISIADATGEEILAPETHATVCDETGRLSGGTVDRLDDEDL